MSGLMTVAELARAVQAREVLGDTRVTFDSVSTDTRTIEAGALFVALHGERFDAHDFVGAARERGAVAAVVERRLPVELPQVVVADARRALGIGAAQWRARFTLPVIAVAGSNGKTTVTQMIGSILAQAFGEKQRLATQGNLNNEIGLPLMLWRIGPQHKAAVFELGMNHPGEIATLAELARPTVALVNNAQREHQEFMHTVEATAHENGEVIAALPLAGDGVAVFPADDACAPIWRGIAGTRRVIDFALDSEAVVTATHAITDEGARVSMATPAGLIETSLAITGVHNVRNALAATACALAIGIDARAIRLGLERFRPVGGRGVRLRTREGARLIDDSYNANPDSVRAAVDLLASWPAPRLLVLGDMGEVGAHGPEFHREVGAFARARGIEELYALGALTRSTIEAFGGGRHFDTVEALVESLRSQLTSAATVLVKGSRFMRMERVVQALAGDAAQGSNEGAH